MAINKVIYGGETIIDISQHNDTTVDNVLSGTEFWDKDGLNKTGTCPFNADTSLDSVNDEYVLEGKTYHRANTVAQREGTMPDNGVQTKTIDAELYTSTEIPIDYGYSANGSKVVITNIESNEIALGKTLFGIVGSHSTTVQYDTTHDKATPLTTQQTISPDTGKVFSNYTVYAIPYREVQTSGTSGYTADIAYLG